MTTLLDNLVSAGNDTFLDALTSGAGVIYTQTGDAGTVLSAGALQGYTGIDIQNVDITLQVYAGALQEVIEPVGPQGYLQSANVQVIMFAGGLQEHAPPFAGTYGQGADVVLVLSAGAVQSHAGGANPGDYLQPGAVLLVLSASALHVFEPIVSSVADQATLVAIGEYKADAPAVAQVDVAAGVTQAGRIELSVQSGSPYYQTGVGPRGGQVFIEVALRRNGARIPLVSLRQGLNSAVFSSLDTNPDRYAALVAALTEGPADFELGAYEVVGNRVRPFAMPATAELNVLVTP